MDYFNAVFVNSLYALLSVFSNPLVLVPVVSCILFAFIGFVFHSLFGGRNL